MLRSQRLIFLMFSLFIVLIYKKTITKQILYIFKSKKMLLSEPLGNRQNVEFENLKIKIVMFCCKVPGTLMAKNWNFLYLLLAIC